MHLGVGSNVALRSHVAEQLGKRKAIWQRRPGGRTGLSGATGSQIAVDEGHGGQEGVLHSQVVRGLAEGGAEEGRGSGVECGE